MKRILIDAMHPEEVRVVVVDGKKVIDFDFVSSAKKQVKGNIYLAKITRVEPSLQAAFVEYGGGKQGFLPFSEIHADYYQIPASDRKRLLEEAAREEDEDESTEPAPIAETAGVQETFPEPNYNENAANEESISLPSLQEITPQLEFPETLIAPPEMAEEPIALAAETPSVSEFGPEPQNTDAPAAETSADDAVETIADEEE